MFFIADQIIIYELKYIDVVHSVVWPHIWSAMKNIVFHILLFGLQ